MLMEQGEEVEPHVLAAAQNTGRIGSQSRLALIFFGVSLPREISQQKWQDEQTTKSCR